jgi:DNA-binding beta-propeller fold protein YncE
MRIVGHLLCALLLALAFAAPPAQAFRPLLNQVTLKMILKPKPLPPPEAQIEGACGLAVSSGGNIHVSDYHHRLVDVFTSGGEYAGQITGVAPAPEGPCGLAIHSSGALYANIWHQRVVRLEPTVQVFDTNHSTGVAVDAAGNVYANDRTYVAVYNPSGTETMQIGVGSLVDGFGLAVSGGLVYVADAANDTVKIYEPSVNPAVPKVTINGSATPRGEFVSLTDGSLAVDPTTGNLLVVDNLQPGFERPKSAIYEFDSLGAFLSQLPGTPIHGGPSGIAADPSSGRLYVTDGNTEGSNVYTYGPFSASGSGFASAPPPPETLSASPASAALAAAGAAAGEQRAAPRSKRSGRQRHRQRRAKREGSRIGVSPARPLDSVRVR